jgi:mRNA interferase MazF
MQPKEMKTIKRGEIYYFDFGTAEGSVQSGRRPVLVLQADNFNVNAPTIIVASITATIKKKYLPSHIILGENFGLSKPSMVLLEQIQTVNKLSLTDYIGCIDDEKIWKKINIAIKKTFGLWFYNLERTGDIRCLCPKCLKGYLDNPNYIVKRLDPFVSARDKCDKCNEMGWDYIIYDRRTALGEKGCSNE